MPGDPDQVILWWSNSIYNVNSETDRKCHSYLPCEEVLVRWNPPDEGWVKVNTDASVSGNGGLASCGGLIRDEDGRWIVGFAKKVGRCDVLKAEFWGIYEGLKLAWSLNLRRVIVESDSLNAVNWILKKRRDFEEGGVRGAILALIEKDWDIRVVHSLREGNRCADRLAGWAMLSDLDWACWDVSPSFMNLFLVEDCIGALVPRGF